MSGSARTGGRDPFEGRGSAPPRSAELLDAALSSARRGWRVVPLFALTPDGACECGQGAACESRGKHPRLTRWPRLATTDEPTLRAWWGQWPTANVGIATGAGSGLLVLDVDPRHGGDESLARLEAQHSPLPRTVRACTGGGGAHVFFKHPGGHIGNQQGAAALAPGLDVRGDGGQVVGAPSLHASGRQYAWEVDHHPDETPLAPAPAWLLALLAQGGHGNGRGGPTPAITETIPVGARNGTLASLAGSMRRRGMTEAEIASALLAVNARRCVPPLDEPEVRAIAGSVGQYPPAAAPVGDAAPTPRTLRTLTWAEMTAGAIEEVAYHWPGWVALATVAVLAAAGDSLKSWLAVYLATMTAAGRPAFAEPGADEPPLRQGPVLYLVGENALAEEKRRCQLLKAGLGLPDELPITFVDAGSLSLSDDADYGQIVEHVARLRPVLIVLDSAIALSGLVRENDNSEVRAFMKRRVLPLAREYGATVLLIAHSPKPPTQPGGRFSDEHVARGAGDWRNAADTVLYLKRDPSLGELAVVLRHAKQRVGPRHRPIWFRLEDVEPGQAVRLVFGGGYSEEGQGIQAGVRKALASAVEVLKGAPTGLPLRDLRQHLATGGTTTASFRRTLDFLRGRKPWPFGPHRGKRVAVVTEEKVGKAIVVTFDVAAWPTDEEWDED